MSRRCEGRRSFEIAFGNLPCKAVRARSYAVAGNHREVSSETATTTKAATGFVPIQVGMWRQAAKAVLPQLLGGSCNPCFSFSRLGGRVARRGCCGQCFKARFGRLPKGSGSQRGCLEGSRLFGWFVPYQTILLHRLGPARFARDATPRYHRIELHRILLPNQFFSSVHGR